MLTGVVSPQMLSMNARLARAVVSKHNKVIAAMKTKDQIEKREMEPLRYLSIKKRALVVPTSYSPYARFITKREIQKAIPTAISGSANK